MNADHIRETCGCGAAWEGPTAYHEQRDKFRDAHAHCREHRVVEAEVAAAIREVGGTIAEAILAGAEYSENVEHARSAIGELAG